MKKLLILFAFLFASISVWSEQDKILKYDFNLVLAGHSHNGQVRIPLAGAIYKTVGAKKYYDPEYSLGDTKMYISGGVGTSKYKVRLFDRPSISLYRLYSK